MKNLNLFRIISILLCVFIVSLAINVFESKRLETKKQHLKIASNENIDKTNSTNRHYSYTIKKIQDNKNITINKIIKLEDKDLLKMYLTFRGDKKRLTSFVNNIKKLENFKEIDIISVNNEKHKEYIANIQMNFIV